MTKPTNKEIAAVFRGAISRLELDIDQFNMYKSEYICHAIDIFITGTPIPNMKELSCVGKTAIKIISDRIFPNRSFTSWLHKNGIPFSIQNMDTKKIQQHRIAWLNMLADEFENKPDIQDVNDDSIWTKVPKVPNYSTSQNIKYAKNYD